MAHLTFYYTVVDMKQKHEKAYEQTNRKADDTILRCTVCTNQYKCEQKNGTKADDSTILSRYNYQFLQKNIA